MLDQWANEWDINPAAIRDLRERFGVVDTSVPVTDGRTEADIQSQERESITKAGGRAFRNNVGCLPTEGMGYVRFGLANDTPAMNKRIKSSDLIGIQPVAITQQHVGSIIGQFLAREVKKEGWKYAGTGREPAQLRFLELITSLGGDAKFVSTTEGVKT
tara:strand:- start:526 stop:1002 length:477 start_codon:yes stop_codon:yes gene_type:complete